MKRTADRLQSDHCAKLLRALSDPVRLRIVDALRDGPKNVSTLTKLLQADIAIVSHHLGILKNAGLVESDKDGRFVVYRLTREVFEPSNTDHNREHLNLGCCRIEVPARGP
ncbi:MAG: ArsR/SmtB family transcription factor [Planctomycetaceae bacterium]